MLPELFGIKETELFQRELTDSERRDIQILYFHKTDVVEEVEVPHVDDEGKEYTVKYSVSQNKETKVDSKRYGCNSFRNTEGKANKELFEQLLSAMGDTPMGRVRRSRQTLQQVQLQRLDDYHTLLIHQVSSQAIMQDTWQGIGLGVLLI
ncbi:hypothetical protein [Paenibacillus gansuensis]|uniref:Uncharacterized protein n=1 Tax=Paenibacillus gansuensis TaxID=306542 RepID=A0ABW5PH32_9BACL